MNAFHSYADFYRIGPYDQVRQTHYPAGSQGGRLFLAEQRPAGDYLEPEMQRPTLQLCVRGRGEANIDLGNGRFRGHARKGCWILAPANQACRYTLSESIDLLVLELPVDPHFEINEPGFGRLHGGLYDESSIFQLAGALWTECSQPSGLGSLWHDSTIMTLAGLLRRCLRRDPTHSPSGGGLAPWQLKRACDALMAQIDENVGLADLAAIVGCSPTHFSRAFKQSTGLPPFAWLLHRRIERAQDLLRESRLPLAQVALAVGFSAQPQFTTAFKRATGMTPGAWRRERLS